MKAVSFQADDDIAEFDLRTIEHFRLIHHTDNRAGNIILPALIHAGHLSSLASDESTAPLFAGFRKAFENLAKHNGVEFFATDVIQKKQRASADDCDVVDAMIHKILTNRVMAVCGKGDFEFRADTVHTGDEDRILHSPEIRTEETSESSDFSQHLRPVCGTDESVDSFFDFVAEVHIDPGSGVGFLFSWSFQSNRSEGGSSKRALMARFSIMSLSNWSSKATG